MKKFELLELAERKKTLITSICDEKPNYFLKTKRKMAPDIFLTKRREPVCFTGYRRLYKYIKKQIFLHHVIN